MKQNIEKDMKVFQNEDIANLQEFKPYKVSYGGRKLNINSVRLP